MKKIILFIGQLLLLLFIGFLTRECWRIYQEQRTIGFVTASGKITTVKIKTISHAKQSLRDAIFNAHYITFDIDGRQHSMRYTQDTIFLQEGAVVPVIYSPSMDECVQPGKELHSREIYKTSPLVRWSVVRLFTGAHAALFFFIVLAAVFVVLATGFIANLTGLALIGQIGRWLIGACAIAAAIYVTYDAFAYWKYYKAIRSNHTEQQVHIEDIERIKDFRDNKAEEPLFYTYQAKITFRGEIRIIAVGETDYEQLKPGDNMVVWYDQEKDDCMSPHFKPKIYSYIFPLVIWAIIIFTVLKSRRRDRFPG